MAGEGETDDMEAIHLRKMVLRYVSMRLKSPFTTSFGTIQNKEFLVVELIDRDGVSGWGESTAFAAPWYNEETVKTNIHMIEDFLFPLLKEGSLSHPDEVSQRFAPIRHNNMAKSALEGAVWDLYARKKDMPLSAALGGSKQTIDVGISLGIQNHVTDLLHLIENYVSEGYKRIKIKIKPGWDIDIVREVRRHFPDLPLMADANSAYSLEDTDHLRKLDEFKLMMIEQPLAHDDIIDHAKLQEWLETPICLDESIHSLADARKAVEMGACGIINIKIGRVGGLSESKQIHDFCRKRGIPVWCGGMLESGIGRAHNVAVTTLEQFILPGDTAASSRYWEKDIIHPEVEVINGSIHVPQGPGIGYEVDRRALDEYTVWSKTIDVNGSN